MKPVIAITMGDYNGIGPEVVLKGIRSPAIRRICSPVLVGSPEVFEYYARRLGIGINFVAVDGVPEKPLRRGIPVLRTGRAAPPRMTPGRLSSDSGRQSAEALELALSLCLSGAVAGMVTAPVSKEAMFRSGYKYPGQTEFLTKHSHAEQSAMMLVAGAFRVALATVHLPLKNVSGALSIEGIFRKLRLIDRTLRRDFALRSPKIAVLGVNPHAGESGHLGSEEILCIKPAIDRARRKGVRAHGPFPADGFFGAGSHRSYDAVLAMYHDQGLVPLKMTAFKTGVNFSAGLPIVRTSPDHGTAFEIAGKGIAHPGSIIQALKLAVTIIGNRRRAAR
jgi:4-hydroxythreonine-4-phosphate dehydrogenase